MTDSADLERHYRRLLVFYPKAFREQHEQEVLAVLMAGAADGQRRPRASDCADLLGNAILAHLHQMKLHPSWDYRQVVRKSLAIEARHPRRSIIVRVAVGVWLLALTAFVYTAGPGGWWGALLVPAAALHFYLAYRLRHTLGR
ncbi:MAG TPA: hypothetical protein VMD79_14380 [Solirubrobacteraceae bacterium]|nr:hypothetical protein [Solirubrobacteraceae bacterium]